MSPRDTAQMYAAGYLTGVLESRKPQLKELEVEPIRDDAGNYTGEVRFRFANRWWSVTPQEVPE